jgi:hypothetical protein
MVFCPVDWKNRHVFNIFTNRMLTPKGLQFKKSKIVQTRMNLCTVHQFGTMYSQKPTSTISLKDEFSK